jgi:hypothetical protein
MSLSHYCVFSRRGNNVSTGLYPAACLHSCYLAMGLHVTVFYQTINGGPVQHASWVKSEFRKLQAGVNVFLDNQTCKNHQHTGLCQI